MRKSRSEQDTPDNHERWLVSYADFITLLFAFFVVMYAISSVNEGKYRVLSGALLSAFGNSAETLGASRSSIVPPLHPTPPSDAMRLEKGRMTEMARDILKVLEPLVKQGKVRVTQTSRGVNVEINDSVLFAPAEARLSPASAQALTAIAAVLKDDDHAIQVEGHTDVQAIRSTLYPSNWELSSARASSVVRLFADNGIAESRLTAVGHGATQAIADNATAEGRQRNRRVVIMVLSRLPDPARVVPLDETGENR
ncbi:MAG TPA: flagellar motor protein MotD [Herbaspirillum sp.]|jgi:chemotaxis protein MotB